MGKPTSLRHKMSKQSFTKLNKERDERDLSVSLEHINNLINKLMVLVYN